MKPQIGVIPKDNDDKQLQWYFPDKDKSPAPGQAAGKQIRLLLV